MSSDNQTSPLLSKQNNQSVAVLLDCIVFGVLFCIMVGVCNVIGGGYRMFGYTELKYN